MVEESPNPKRQRIETDNDAKYCNQLQHQPTDHHITIQHTPTCDNTQPNNEPQLKLDHQHHKIQLEQHHPYDKSQSQPQPHQQLNQPIDKQPEPQRNQQPKTEASKQQQDYQQFEQLPYEVVLRILGWLEYQEVVRIISLVSHKWKDITQQSQLWRLLYKRYWDVKFVKHPGHWFEEFKSTLSFPSKDSKLPTYVANTIFETNSVFVEARKLFNKTVGSTLKNLVTNKYSLSSTIKHPQDQNSPVCTMEVREGLESARVALGHQNGRISIIDEDLAYNAHIWDFKVIRRRYFRAHNSPLRSITFHPHTNDVFVTCGRDDPIARLWKVGTDSEITEFTSPYSFPRNHSQPVSDVSFHPSGRYVAGTSLDGMWSLYDAERGCTIIEQKEENPIFCGGFHVDGMLFATQTVDTLYMWDVRLDRVIAESPLRAHTSSKMRFSNNGYILSVIGEEFTLLDLRVFPSSDLLAKNTIDEQITNARFDLSGKYCLTMRGPKADLLLRTKSSQGIIIDEIPGNYVDAFFGIDSTYLLLSTPHELQIYV